LLKNKAVTKLKQIELNYFDNISVMKFFCSRKKNCINFFKVMKEKSVKNASILRAAQRKTTVPCCCHVAYACLTQGVQDTYAIMTRAHVHRSANAVKNSRALACKHRLLLLHAFPLSARTGGARVSCARAQIDDHVMAYE
jgi:hypothetical protein